MEATKLSAEDLQHLFEKSDVLRAAYTEAHNAIAPLEGEPLQWYLRFITYYVPNYFVRGPYGALTAGYREYYSDKHGHEPTRPGYTSSWLQASRRYSWEARAERAANQIATKYTQDAIEGQLANILNELVIGIVSLDVRLKVQKGNRVRYIPLGTIPLQT